MARLKYLLDTTLFSGRRPTRERRWSNKGPRAGRLSTTPYEQLAISERFSLQEIGLLLPSSSLLASLSRDRHRIILAALCWIM